MPHPLGTYWGRVPRKSCGVSSCRTVSQGSLTDGLPTFIVPCGAGAPIVGHVWVRRRSLGWRVHLVKVLHVQLKLLSSDVQPEFFL